MEIQNAKFNSKHFFANISRELRTKLFKILFSIYLIYFPLCSIIEQRRNIYVKSN